MIVLINPEDSFLDETGGNKGDRAPLWAGSISSYIKSKGYDVSIFDLNHDKRDEVLKFIEDDQTKFVCISISTPNYEQCIELSKVIKNEGRKIIAGGNHVTDFPDEKNTLENFDHIIVGDGEETLLNIVEGREDRKIIYSEKIEPLNKLPHPDYEGLKFERYNLKVDGVPGAIVITSRGCTMGCCYCGSAKIKKWRSRTPEHVMEELRILYHKYNKRAFYFADDIFTLSKARVAKLSTMIKEEFPDVIWRATTRADMLSDELCKVMSESGCTWISLGIESGSDKVLKSMNKFMTVSQQKRGIDLCIKNGISVKAFYLFPLPGEDKNTIQETINWTKEIKKEYGDKYKTDIYMLVPYYNTPLWNNPEKFGIEIYKTDNWKDYNQILYKRSKPLFKHPNFTEEEIQFWINKFKEEIGENSIV